MNILTPLNELAKANHNPDTVNLTTDEELPTLGTEDEIAMLDSHRPNEVRPMTKPPIDQGSQTALRVLMLALEPFRAHNPTMPLQLAFTFLMVARKEGEPVSEYAKMAGMAPGVMARNLLDLGDYNRRREPGLMLIEEKVDTLDRRVHRKFLTHKGRQLVGAITRAMEQMKAAP